MEEKVINVPEQEDKFLREIKESNKQYRNSVFCSYFNDKKRLLSLCNAILDTNYTDENELEINTLDTSMMSNQKNDISCKIRDNFLILVEHQTSVNQNMPFRFLSYVIKLFDNLIEDRNKLYQAQLIRFPAPKFIVLYDGNKEEALEKEMKLSEAFGGDSSSLELVVKSFNINYGLEQPLLEKCRYLKEYSTLIGYVKRGIAIGLSLRDAIIKAVTYCRENNVMKEYLLDHEKEVLGMIAGEWKIEEAKSAWEAQAREVGKAEGINIGIERIATNMLQKGKGFKEIHEMTELPLNRIQELANAM